MDGSLAFSEVASSGIFRHNSLSSREEGPKWFSLVDLIVLTGVSLF